MITRPLDLASKLRPAPRNFDWLFVANAGLLVLFFSVFGSRFILAPWIGVAFRLPAVAGANAAARPPTHVINVIDSGQIFTADGPQKLEAIGGWLRAQAAGTTAPLLLIRADRRVPASVITDIASAAAETKFEVLLAAEEPKARSATVP